MNIRREWAMSSADTFSIPVVRGFIERIIDEHGCSVGVDPFVRYSPFKHLCRWTNDLNPSIDAGSHCEAFDFLSGLDSQCCDLVFFDPPFSPRQITESYASFGMVANQKDTSAAFYGDRKRECARILSVGGVAISCGWNSNGLGKSNGMMLADVLMVAHGGWKNDTIVTVEKKVAHQDGLFCVTGSE